MKKFKYILCIASLTLCCSCADYLDVVPDDTPTLDHIFVDRANAESFLFTCYSSLPSYESVTSNPAFFAGGEFVCITNSGELWHSSDWSDLIAPSYRILMGQQNVGDPYINFWDGSRDGKNLFIGIRNCNIFLENIDKPIDLSDAERKRWIAEARFLKAYYHYWLFQMYGPIPIVDKNIPVSAMPEEVQVYREPVDDVVNYIVSELDAATPDLPKSIDMPLSEMGRITQPIALALKAKVLALAASPLFNGNEDFKSLTDNRGIKLFPQDYDKEKWKKASEAALAAIQSAEESGHKLYKFVNTRGLKESTVKKMNIRGAVTDNYNEEIIWGAAPKASHVQLCVLPILTGDPIMSNVNAEMSVPLSIAEEFYSKNGVPINEDKYYDYVNRYKPRQVAEEEVSADNIKSGEWTAGLNFDREVRFYASLSFDRSILYGAGVLSDVEDEDEDKSPHVIKSRFRETNGKMGNTKYNLTGYFPTKLAHWESAFADGKTLQTATYHFPVIRLADLYLLYAEAETEYSDDINPQVYDYIDAVRERASLGGVVESWNLYSTNPDKPANKTGLLDIIRRERMIELAFEGQRFWDMRRWKTLSSYVNKPFQGWNIDGTTVEDYYQIRTVLTTSFGRKDYLWPISQSALDTNKNLVQNPGWE